MNIIFFDGQCNLCNSLVRLLVRLDRKRTFYYAPLTGITAKKYKLGPNLDYLVFKDSDDKFYFASNAVIEILARVSFIGKLSYLLKVFPRSFRDFIYRVVAKSRYRLFGKNTQCKFSSEQKIRLLD